MSQQDKRIYQFDSFQLDAEKRRLFRGREALGLAAKAIDILVVLVENRDRVVEKEELMQKVWADSFVEEANVTVHMSALRKALGDSKNVPRYIMTISGRGYRFLADVKEVEERDDDRSDNKEPEIQAHSTASLNGAHEFETDAVGVRNHVSSLKIDEGAEFIVEEHSLSRITMEDRPQESKNLPLAPASRRPRGLRVILAIAFTLTVAFLLYRLILMSSEAGATIKSIAVLPFKPISAEARNENLEIGMAETLISKFNSIGRIVVRPTSAIRKYGDAQQDAVAAGRELGVDAVLDGSIQRAGDLLRINVYLRDVKSGKPLWQNSYNESFKNIFDIQDRVSEQVAQALTLTLTGEEQKQLTRHPTNNTEAYEAYLQGRYFWNKRTQEAYKKAIGYFDEALRIDPNFALAYSGLADCYLFRSEQLPAKEAMQKAKDAAVKALEIDSSLAEAHTSLAKIQQFYDWDWAAAESSFQRAIALNPNYHTAHHWYAQYLMDVGRQEEAFTEIHRARELEPFSLIINTDVGSLFQDARQYDQAIAAYRKVIEMDAGFARAHFELGRALEQKGLYEEALKEIQKAIELSGPSPRMLASMGYIYAVSGNPAKALEVIAQLNERARQTYVSPYHLAMIYAGLGKKDEALKLLEQAYQGRFGLLVYLKIEPRFDNLREEPQFKDLLGRIWMTR
jgi:DNA-binding winged helix-turn-helix (wHTH) protein/TolB-like protein/cytochrome c-type biogenesis protein CcmH/NrfG